MTDAAQQTGLTVEIEDGAIVIRLPIDTIPWAAPIAFDEAYGYEQHSLKVTDAAVFAKEVLRELDLEDEDGTTLVHLMFDRAFVRAVENGAEGVEDETA